MSDQYPKMIELDVSRDALRGYLRAKWFLSWLGFSAFLGVMIGFGRGSHQLERGDIPDTYEIVVTLARAVGSGLLIGVAVATILYLLLSHRLAAKMAAGLRVIVDGPFLRIVQNGHFRSDRKLHFRAIVDYATEEGCVMRAFGIATLVMSTTGGGPQNTLRIAGLKDCEKARDMLAEIDSIRESTWGRGDSGPLAGCSGQQGGGR